MKRILLLLFTAFMLVNCTKEEQEELYLEPEKLVGEWVFNTVDGQQQETNEWFVCKFNKDSTQEYLKRVDIDGINSKLNYKDNLVYNVDGNIISLKNETDDIRLVAFILDAQKLGQESDVISWAEYVNIENGMDVNQGRSFTGYRSENNYKNQIIGVWDGISITGSEVADHIRIEFFTDNTYLFYSKDTNGQWIKKDDNLGRYRTLANLLVNEWNNDINSGIKGVMSESWQISINGDYMTWRATRANETKVGFDLVRVL